MKNWIVGGLILVIFLLVLIPGVHAEEQYQYVTQWGMITNSEDICQWCGSSYTPFDIVADSTDNIYVLDYYRWSESIFPYVRHDERRFQEYSSEGILLHPWKESGGNIVVPSGIAVDSKGNVYIADKERPSIVKYGPDGEFIRRWGSYGVDNGQFRVPYDVAVDLNDMIYVSDSAFELSRIQKFDSEGTFLTKWYTPSDESTTITSLAVDTQGYVYVLTDYSHILKFTPGGSLVKEWGSSGENNGEFYYASGLAVDTIGNVYVADMNNNRIQKFDSEGTFITKWGSEGSGNGEFSWPAGVAVDSSGNVYVLDKGNFRVQKFAKVVIPTPMVFDAKCPVDISVTDPEGHTISKLVNEIAGASYAETGLGSDNRPDVQIIIPDKKPGKYTITATPRNGVLPTETFSLEVTSGGVTQIIVQNFLVGSIDGKDFGIDVSSEGVITISGSGGIPSPEFPSIFLPAALIIGFLGTVLLIQRTREH